MREYKAISEEEFKATLNTLPVAQVISLDLRPDIQEMIFDLSINSGDSHVIRVYSSVDYRYGSTRDSGEDAIRIIAVNPETHFVLTNFKKVLRINTWEKNLTERLTEAITFVTNFYKLNPQFRDMNTRNARIRAKMETNDGRNTGA